MTGVKTCVCIQVVYYDGCVVCKGVYYDEQCLGVYHDGCVVCKDVYYDGCMYIMPACE